MEDKRQKAKTKCSESDSNTSKALWSLTNVNKITLDIAWLEGVTGLRDFLVSVTQGMASLQNQSKDITNVCTR